MNDEILKKLIEENKRLTTYLFVMHVLTVLLFFSYIMLSQNSKTFTVASENAYDSHIEQRAEG